MSAGRSLSRSTRGITATASEINAAVAGVQPEFFNNLSVIDNIAPHLNETGATQLLQRADLNQDVREKMKVLIEENNPRVADALKNAPAWTKIESLERGEVNQEELT